MEVFFDDHPEPLHQYFSHRTRLFYENIRENIL
jgi:hypothetical protein